MDSVYPNLLKQLDDLREVVRGPLSRMERMILSALIVIEVHARDVVSNMIELKVTTSFLHRQVLGLGISQSAIKSQTQRICY